MEPNPAHAEDDAEVTGRMGDASSHRRICNRSLRECLSKCRHGIQSVELGECRDLREKES